ncbi:MAG: methyltransferase domain-containing protein [Myxococcaceae bacterium]|nr:methyltransferase domain-containing protein [Myxococcaceae bacterium]
MRANESVVRRFKRWSTETFGFSFETGTTNLTAVLESHAAAARTDPLTYVERLEGGAPVSELRALAHALTVTETYFFRHREQFTAFADLATALGAERSRLRVLSAACASGEETYSLAAMLPPASAAWGAHVLGADLNLQALQKARLASYSVWSLRDTPAELRDLCFERAGDTFRVRPDLRARVTFEEHNLVDPDDRLLTPERFEIVFCRNMLMYLTRDRASDLVRRFAKSLVPGGYLFLGHAETLRGLTNDFDLLHTHGTFYYQRRGALAHPVTAQPRPAVATPAAPPLATEETWVDAIGRASERVRSLTHARAPELAAPSPRVDPEALLLEAVELTHQGDVDAARERCRALLDLDGLNAGAHYLSAVCDEAAGDLRAAESHDQTAAYLDASFAMPRLHLGLLARRAGRLGDARRELEQALVLLPHEEPARLVLFGGGFARQQLVDLCRAELKACGGSA